MENMESTSKTFDQFKEFIGAVDVPAQRTGIFNLDIRYRGKNYIFNDLKENAGHNEDLHGFGLNHHFGCIQELPTRKSIFHDSEDVSIDIWRHEVVRITQESDTRFLIETKKWTGTLTIGKTD